MNVLIIEDEPTATQRLQRLLKNYDAQISILDQLDTVEGAVKWFGHHPAPDLILMDIKLADGMCFEIFNRVEVEAPVIFCTAYDNFAIRAFKVNSVDYLLKPIEEEALHAALDKFKKIFGSAQQPADGTIRKLMSMMTANYKECRERFLVKVGRRFISVPVEKIALFYTKHKIVLLVTHSGKEFALDQTLDELECCLHPQKFFRVNRQEIINIDAIQSVEKESGSLSIMLKLKGKEEIAISRKRIADFKQWMGG